MDDDISKAAKDLMNISAEIVETLRNQKAREILERIGFGADAKYYDYAVLAAQISDMPIACVGLIADGYQFHKGLIYDGMAIEDSKVPTCDTICQVQLANPEEPLIINDTGNDIRTVNLPFVNGEKDLLRFYAGIPLTTKDGYTVGTLCVCDRKPRELSDEQLRRLKHLSHVIMKRLDD